MKQVGVEWLSNCCFGRIEGLNFVKLHLNRLR
jgi:hypothetical protein